MRNYNILLIAGMLLLPFLSSSQTSTTSPAIFTAEDEVTISVDVTGTPLADYASDIYIWAWISDGCSAECDAPTNVSPATPAQDAAKMTRDVDNANLYHITLVPVDFYNKTPAEIKEMGFLLKGADWPNGQTSDLSLKVQSLEFVAEENRTFPLKFTKDDLVTFYFDRSLTASEGMKTVDDIYTYFFISGTDESDVAFADRAYVAWGDVGLTPEVKLTSQGNELYSLTMLPQDFFGLNTGDVLSKISYIFRDADGNNQTETFEAFVLTID